jgi:nuclear GTP-binding protein
LADEAGEEEEEELDDQVPMLVNPDLVHLKAVLDEADVVIELLDCRDPLSYRNAQLEKVVGKKLVFVLNKIGVSCLDLCTHLSND